MGEFRSIETQPNIELSKNERIIEEFAKSIANLDRMTRGYEKQGMHPDKVADLTQPLRQRFEDALMALEKLDSIEAN